MKMDFNSNKISILLLCVALSFLVFAGCSTSSSKHLESLPEPVSFDPPEPETWTMDNGLKVLYLRDSEFPLVSGTLYMKGGDLWEAPELGSSVSAMGNLMRDGGAGKYSADALDEKLQSLSAKVGSSFGDEHGSVSFFGLSEDFSTVFGLFADVLFRPKFEQSRLDLWKGQAIESIRRRIDDSSTVASISFRQILYGADSHYGYVSTEQDIKKISRVELLRLHREFVRPNDGILAVTGDVSRHEVEKMIRLHFSNWDSRSEELGEAPPVDNVPKPGIYFLELPFAQSTVYMGHLGVRRLPPDFMEIEVFNDVFGSGGFGSRLFKRIRTELGLAYGVYGAIQPAVVKGRNIIAVQTKAETTGEATAESLKVLKGLKSELINKTELENTIRSRENSFVFRFESPARIIERIALLDLLDYPPDFDERYIERLHGVTREGVREVAERRWRLEDFVIVVVGNQDAYKSLQAATQADGSLLSGVPIFKVGFSQRLIMN